MELVKALDQISEIHDHLARGEVFRGYRPLPVAFTGVCALAAACAQPAIAAAVPGWGFVSYWVVVAFVCVAVCGGAILYNFIFREDLFSRRRTGRVLGQFLPCVVAGGTATFILLRVDPTLGSFLPGLWALFFSLGVFASRPYLPRATGWVALGYLIASFYLLLVARHPGFRPEWGVGATFGAGQLLTALVLYWNLERKEAA